MNNKEMRVNSECYIRYTSAKPELVSKDGTKAIELGSKEYPILLYFIEHKNKSVSLEDLAVTIWGENYEGDIDSIKPHISKLRNKLDSIREGLRACLATNHGFGTYTLIDKDAPIIEEDASTSKHGYTTISNPQAPAEEDMKLYRSNYYEIIWQNHYKGFVRDQVATGNVRELIDYFVLPSITNQNGDFVLHPFSGSRFSRFVMAGSGFGKSTLLDVLLLCNVIDSLFESGSEVLSQNSKEKIKEYNSIKESLFGTSDVRMFPVFIHSNKANSCLYSSALDLAEANEPDYFKLLVDVAHSNGTLLFLIDSIDEVESDNLNIYLDSIEKMLSDFPNANVVFASRFLGKKSMPFGYDLLHLKELNNEGIQKITLSILSYNEAKKMLGRFRENAYLCSLAKNPFMLMTILEIKGDHLVHHLLKSIVNAIIDRRWDKHHYDISTENIELLLGFLACKFAFENKTDADISEIGQCFLKAGKNLKLHGVSYDVPIQNIEYFLKTLSSQSGILNIVNQHHIEKYLFQDTLIMCWLAANYINKIINESGEIQDRNGISGIWANVFWLDRFIRTISSRETYLSVSAVNVLVMALVMSSEDNGQDIQKSVLYYLICRDATSLNEQEQLNICTGYRDLVYNSFGLNDITNRSSSDSLKLIENRLDAHARKKG